MSSLGLTQERAPATAGVNPLVVGLVVGALLMVLAGAATRTLTTQIGYGSVALCLFAIAATLNMAGDQGLRHSLWAGQMGPLFALSASLLYGLTSLVWVGDPPAEQAALISRDSILAGMAVVCLALSCFVVGYRGLPYRSARAMSSRVQRLLGGNRELRKGQRWAWLLLSLALIAIGIQVGIGRFGYLSDPNATSSPVAGPLGLFAGFGVYAAALSAYDCARHRSARAMLSLVLLLLAQTVLGAVSGGKEPVIMGFVAACFGWSAGVRRFPIEATIVVAVAFVFVLVPFNTAYRQVVSIGNSRLSPFEVAQEVGVIGLGQFLNASQGGSTPAGQTVDRISRIGDVAIIVQETGQSVPYRPVSELVEAPFLGLVPRALWADKPVFAPGYVFSQEYYLLPYSIYTYHAVTPEGDLWRHGAWPVLVVGMIVLGGAIRVLDASTEDPSQFPLRILVVLAFLPLVVKHEVDAVGLVGGLPTLLLGVAIAARLVATRRPSRAIHHAAASAVS